MQCLQAMAVELSLASLVGGKAAVWPGDIVAQRFIAISCCGFPRGNGSLELDRWETDMFCGSGEVTDGRRWGINSWAVASIGEASKNLGKIVIFSKRVKAQRKRMCFCCRGSICSA